MAEESAPPELGDFKQQHRQARSGFRGERGRRNRGWEPPRTHSR
jgi:hypothetical protein